jgi:hypothetical protein
MHRDTIMKVTNKIQLYVLIYYSHSALHVSGDIFAHHQEHLTVFTVSGSIHLSRCRLVSWMSWSLNWKLFSRFNSSRSTWTHCISGIDQGPFSLWAVKYDVVLTWHDNSLRNFVAFIQNKAVTLLSVTLTTVSILETSDSAVSEAYCAQWHSVSLLILPFYLKNFYQYFINWLHVST